MTTAIIGTGNLGSGIARNLVTGGESVVLASTDGSTSDALAVELGDFATSATVEDAAAQADAVVLALWLDAEKSVVSQLGDALAGKVVIDPSNPVSFDANGAVSRTLPEETTSASVIAALLPQDAHLVKAFGSMSATSLESAANQEPDQAVVFYATDDETAAAAAERLIRASGFAPVKVGGLDSAGRLEVGGDLHQFGGLQGKLVTESEATALL